MKVQVRFLGIFRDLAGHTVGEYQLPEHGTVRDLVNVIGTRHERLGQMRGQYRIMVNAVQSTADQELHAGDEIVVLGPISGGSADAEDVAVGRIVRITLTRRRASRRA